MTETIDIPSQSLYYISAITHLCNCYISYGGNIMIFDQFGMNHQENRFQEYRAQAEMDRKIRMLKKEERASKRRAELNKVELAVPEQSTGLYPGKSNPPLAS